MVDAEIDPAGVGGDVVDAVGRHLAEFGDHEVVHPHRLGLALGTQLTAAILEVADQLLLLGVDRDGRLAGSLERLDLRVDVLELCVAVGMGGTFACLAVGLQAEAQTPQQPADQLLTGGEAALGQRRTRWRWLLLTHSKAASGSPRIADCTSSLQRLQKPRFRLGLWLTAAARSANPARSWAFRCAAPQGHGRSCCERSPSPRKPPPRRRGLPHEPRSPRTTDARARPETAQAPRSGP